MEKTEHILMILPLHGMQYRWWETSPVKAHTQIQSGRIISQEICYEAASQTENTIAGCMQYILPARKRVPWKGIINVCQQAYRAKFIIYHRNNDVHLIRQDVHMQIMDCLKKYMDTDRWCAIHWHGRVSGRQMSDGIRSHGDYSHRSTGN